MQHPVLPTTCPHLIPSTPSIHQFTLFSCSPLVRSSQKLGLKYQVLVLVMSRSSLKSNKWFVFHHSPIHFDILLLLGHGWSSRGIHVQLKCVIPTAPQVSRYQDQQVQTREGWTGISVFHALAFRRWRFVPYSHSKTSLVSH